MTNTDFIALVNDSFEQSARNEEAARAAALSKAKTNFQALLAIGVITTCDDEYSRAQVWYGDQENAKLAGVSHAVYTNAREWSNRANSIIDGWKSVSLRGETQGEYSFRFSAAVAALPVRFEEGAKKPCKHNETKSKRGIISIGNDRHVCCRCGVEFSVLYISSVKTASAIAAEELYLQFRNE